MDTEDESLETFEVADLANELAPFVEHDRDSRPVRFEWDVAADAGSIRTNRTHLFLVLSELLGNARKFTEKGVIRFTVRAVRTADEEGDQVVFEIHDTGCGIPEDWLHWIFTPFERRFHPNRNGLGLALAARLCEGIGAMLGVESTLGVGSTVWVVIPRIPAKPVRSRTVDG